MRNINKNIIMALISILEIALLTDFAYSSQVNLGSNPAFRPALRVPLHTKRLQEVLSYLAPEKTGYAQILKTRVVGGQEITVLEEEKIDPDLVEPQEVIVPKDDERIEIETLADQELKAGRVGVITVAGGMSSRAGLDYPKGMTPVTPISRKTLFENTAEELLAVRKIYGKPVTWFIMSSGANGNDEAIRKYFEENDYFGLGKENIVVIKQDSVAALESGTDKTAMQDESNILKTPNGHGGMYKAMRDPSARTDGGSISALQEAEKRGIKTFLYTHVDNALPVINRTLLGYHIKENSDYTTTLIKKRDSQEGLAMAVRDKVSDGRFFIEYNQPAAKIIRDREGFEFGSINRNVYSYDFLAHVTDLPYHVAAGKDAKIYKRGEFTQGKIDKFECFVFDALSQAKRSINLVLPRGECFAAFKNMEGPDSPITAAMAISDFSKDLIRRAFPDIDIPEALALELPPEAHFMSLGVLREKLKEISFESYLHTGLRLLIASDFTHVTVFFSGADFGNDKPVSVTIDKDFLPDSFSFIPPERLELKDESGAKTFIVFGAFYQKEGKLIDLGVDEDGKLFTVRKLISEEDEAHCSGISEVMKLVPVDYEQIYRARIMSAGKNQWAGLEDALAVVYPYERGKNFEEYFARYRGVPLSQYAMELFDITIRLTEICTYLEELGVPGVWDINPHNIIIAYHKKLIYLIDYTEMHVELIREIEWIMYSIFDKAHYYNIGIEGVLPDLRFVEDEGLNSKIINRLHSLHRNVIGRKYDSIIEFLVDLKDIRGLFPVNGPGHVLPWWDSDVLENSTLIRQGV